MVWRYSILLLLLLSFQGISLAQLSKPGLPPSFSHTSLEDNPPFELMQVVDIASLEAEDLIVDTIVDIPWRFGENIVTNLNPDNSGLWETTTDGDRIWRLGIRSPGAYSINLTFDWYVLPPGAELYVYNTDRAFILGAFTEANNQEDMYFATSLVPGEEVIIEYFEPSGAPFSGILNLETVTHAYRSIFDHTKRFGSSGSCHLNVACEEANGWDNEIDAVVMMLVGSNGFCTGTLINNTGFDGRPLLLSANHCFQNPSTLVFWFNWQSTTCENPAQSPPYDALSGAVSRARFSSSDTWLLELNHKVPIDYNPYYAGWNRTLDSRVEGPLVSIHHPLGDIKKFSYALEGASASSYLLGPGIGTSHWHLTWSGGTTTEKGSSGSPLYDSYGRIIGQLHGGYAACGNTKPDWYGRFGISWIGGNSPATRLSDWLDPFDSDVQAIDSYRPERKDIDPVDGFTARALSFDSIHLSWDDHSQNHPVLIAWNTSDMFGTPAGTFSLDDPIPGGGKVLYMGNGEESFFKPPYPNTTYYFRAWAYDKVFDYSTGVNASSISLEKIISDLPYEEIFDDSRSAGWSMLADSGEPSWRIGTGNNAGKPSTPFAGEYNAFFRPEKEVHTGKSAMLISPPIDFGAYDFGEVSFYYTNAAIDQLQDILYVFYRPDKESEWALLDSLGTDTRDWTERVYELPEISGALQLGFLAQWNGGHGVCLDAINISGSYDAFFAPPEGLEASITSGHSVSLNWMAPGNTEHTPELQGYQIFIDSQVVASIEDPDQNYFDVEGLGISSCTFYVTAIYANPPGESEPSNTFSVNIQPLTNTFSLSLISVGDGKTVPETLTTIQYNEGAIVTLLATPDSDYLFSGWWVDHELMSMQEEYRLTIDRDYDLEARFSIKQYVVDVSSDPAGIGVQEGSGIYSIGETAHIRTRAPFGYRFVGWMESGRLISNSPAFSLEVFENLSISAHFESLVHVSLIAEPSSAGLVRGGGLFEIGTLVDILAYANDGWVFDYWEEDGEILTTHPSIEFEAVQDRQLTAVFSVPEYTVTATVIPDEAGVVTGTGTFLEGDHAVLVSVSYDDWLFVGWFEQDTLVSRADTLSLTIDRDRHFEVFFEPRFYQFVISIEGSGSTAPAPGIYNFEKGERVSLSAYPNRGWRFKYWIINDSIITDPELEMTVIESVDAHAVFYFPDTTSTYEPVDHALTVYPNPSPGVFTIFIHGIYGGMLLEVYNMNGQRLVYLPGFAGTGQETITKTIDLSTLGSGVYVLKVTGNNFTMFERIIIR